MGYFDKGVLIAVRTDLIDQLEVRLTFRADKSRIFSF